MDDKIRLGLTFDDVLLEPRESGVVRDGVRLETKLTRKINLKIPIISAAMDTVSETAMAVSMAKLGGLAVLHRNCSIEQQVRMIKKVKSAKPHLLVGAAVGSYDLARAKALDKAGADVIVVDTAHAHNLQTIKGTREIKKAIRAQLIVGNIATREAATELVKFADAVKVGIGPGSICTTRVVAGIGVPQLTAILDVAAVARKKNIPVIADGGMKYSGDIVKALAAGASTVMLGSMLSGTKEAPGKVVKIKGQFFKSYRGMGSLGVMQGGKSSDRYFQHPLSISPGSAGRINGGYVPEGVEAVTPYKGELKNVIFQITGGLRSGMGYIGARTIADIPKKARFIRITNAGLRESHPHSVSIVKKSPNY